MTTESLLEEFGAAWRYGGVDVIVAVRGGVDLATHAGERNTDGY